jgi:phosphoglycolate phosphatase
MEGDSMKAVIFDLDGTLVDSAPDIHAALNALLRGIGCQPLSYKTVTSFIGNGIPKLVERAMRASDIEFEANRHQNLTDVFTSLYTKHPADRTTLYPGVQEALERFQAQGIALGVCTNKSHTLTLQVLRALNIDGFFGAVICGDSLPQRKPNPIPLLECSKQLNASNVIYVGDSEIDGETARAARLPFVLYTEGYRKKPVDKIPHIHSFGHFENLFDFVTKTFRIETSP